MSDNNYEGLSAGARISLMEEDEQVQLNHIRTKPHFDKLAKQMDAEFRERYLTDIGDDSPIRTKPQLGELTKKMDAEFEEKYLADISVGPPDAPEI